MVVDYLAPVEALFPGVDAAVLSVLARTLEPLTLRQIAERARATHPQVSRHVDRFEELGIVRRRIAGRSHLISLTDSAAANLIRDLTNLRDRVVEQMRAAAAHIDPAPESVVVFGSFAQGTARAGSDVDIVVVAPPGSGEDEEWLSSLADWIDAVGEISGNPVAEIVISLDELRDREADPLWDNILRDGILLLGRPLDELMTTESTGRGF